jgi:sec-independent protein translocase protein TatA
MKFGGIGVPELLIILAVALLIFGPKHLPKLGSAFGKTIKNLREGLSGAPEPKEDTVVKVEDVESDEASGKVKDATSKKAASDAPVSAVDQKASAKA